MKFYFGSGDFEKVYDLKYFNKLFVLKVYLNVYIIYFFVFRY